MPLAGIEPALLAESDFESDASTSSATGASDMPNARFAYHAFDPMVNSVDKHAVHRALMARRQERLPEQVRPAPVVRQKGVRFRFSTLAEMLLAMSDLMTKALDDADVDALYRAILRRPPESAEAIRHHREHSRTVIGLVGTLLGSDEFRFGERERNAGTMQLTGEPPHCFVTFTGDDAIGAQIRWNGHFEEHHVGEVMRRLGVDPARKPWFVDIGSNIGTHSLFALRNGFERALCVEPEPRNFRLLRVNQILNGFDARCRNVMAAVTDFNGTITLELADDNLGDHRVKGSQAGDEHFRESGRQHVEVPARTFDDIIAEQGVDPGGIGLAWIDTQGHEGQVLSRADSLLSARVPMVIEFWPYGLDRVAGFPRLREVLARCGRIETVGSGELMDMAAIDAAYATLLQQPEKGAAYLDLVLLP